MTNLAMSELMAAQLHAQVQQQQLRGLRGVLGLYGHAYVLPQAQRPAIWLPWDNAHTKQRDPSQSIGLCCPDCGHRPAWRSRRIEPRKGIWECSDPECKAEFTLADVLRYLWNRKS